MLFIGQATAQNSISVSPWRMYRGDVITLDKQKTVLTRHGDSNAYAVMNIPEKTVKGWQPAKYGDDGEVKFEEYSSLPCDFSQIQPTYFESVVTIPPGTKVTDFSVSYLKADDGARIYIFNSKNPKGAFDPKADLSYGQVNTGVVNLSRFVADGENRVVIAQYDDCGAAKPEFGNSVHGIDIKVNGEVVTPKVLPNRFKLHAYSISGKRVEKGSDYWMGFDEKAQKVNAANNNAKYYDGKIVSPKDATVMEFERVDIDKEKGIIMLRLVNSPLPNLYLQVTDDKLVRPYPGTTASGRGYFYVRVPEEKEAGDLNFVSLETAGYPSNGGWFLRHEGYGLKVTPGNSDTRKNVVYRQDATWLFEPVK